MLNAPLGTIAIDSIHTPIKNVKFSVENVRVEQKTDYEKLVFLIDSDGSIQEHLARLKENINRIKKYKNDFSSLEQDVLQCFIPRL